MIALLFSALINKAWMTAREPVNRFCERHLIAEDPWPFAEHSNDQLLVILEQGGPSPMVQRELEYRRAQGLLTPAEQDRFDTYIK